MPTLNPYPKQTWHNKPLTDTPLEADRMNHLEGQYDAAMADAAVLYGADVRAWAPSAVYAAGQGVISPTTGDVVTAKTAHTSGATFSGTGAGGNWNLPTAFAPAGDLRAFGIFTPENYGAPAYGTDATTAIQSAINAAAAFNGGTGGRVRLLRPYSAAGLVWKSGVFIEAVATSGAVSGLDPNLPLTGPCIQLLAGANQDLIKTAWFDALSTGTTLNGSISAGATTIVLTNAAIFPTAPVSGAAPMTVTIESDVVTYTGISGNTLTGVSGVTTTHASGVTVKLQANAYQTPRHVGSRGLVLDGNKTNNSAGRCLAMFTIDHDMSDFVAQNSYGDAVYSNFGAIMGEMARWTNFRIWGAGLFTILVGSQALNSATLNVQSTAGFPTSGSLNIQGAQVNYTGTTPTSFTGCTGGNANTAASGEWAAPWGVYSHGLNFQGPNDSIFVNGSVYNCTGSGIIEGSSGGNLSFVNVHSWGNGLFNWDMLCGTASHVNCESDGTGHFNKIGSRLAASLVSWMGGSIYGVNGKSGQTLLQIGKGDGTASLVTGCDFETMWYFIAAPSVPLLYADAANLTITSNRFAGSVNQAGNNQLTAYGNIAVTVGDQAIGTTGTLVVRDAIANMPASGKLYITNGSGGVLTVSYSSFSGSTFTLSSAPAVTVPGGSVLWNVTSYSSASFVNETYQIWGVDGTASYLTQIGGVPGGTQAIDSRPIRFAGAVMFLNHTTTTQTLSTNGAVAFSTSTGDVQVVNLQANMTSSTATLFANQIVTFVLKQDATGGRTYVWPTNFKFAGGTGPSDTTASKITSVTMRCDGANWLELSRSVAVG